MQFLYNFFIQLYQIAFRLAAFFNPKAKLAVDGRRNWEENLKQKINPDEKWIWMHCSSLGEFEQGRPVFEALKQKYPQHKLALSFFSPSGYEIRKNYALADVVFYLPFDSAKNAKKLAQILQPEIWILVKYDYWYNHLKFQNAIGTKIVVISAIFRENQIYFKPWGNWLASKLKQYITHFFVQDEISQNLLQKIDIHQVTIAGDTRFDRVKSIAAKTEKLDWIENFKGNHPLIVVGSSWKDDEDLWVKFIHEKLPENWKVVIVPHEIKPENIQRLKNALQDKCLIFSENKSLLMNDGISTPLDERTTLNSELITHNSQILIIDAIGFLSQIYASADIAYVGGGFNKSGVHNTLEPAVFGIPVIIGPNFQKFNEVKMLKNEGIIFPITNENEFSTIIHNLIHNKSQRAQIKEKSAIIFNQQLPSTQIILDRIHAWLN
ncbi:MAG: glycosyltransferase N-terminal domain-containing protein [Flavobacteriaceae bacterium]|nr:glycosyltransferase N-terminal domain-containing protein [Flavobacteriaceae bacterium]